jgi:hypothetical protein
MSRIANRRCRALIPRAFGTLAQRRDIGRGRFPFFGEVDELAYTDVEQRVDPGVHIRRR